MRLSEHPASENLSLSDVCPYGLVGGNFCVGQVNCPYSSCYVYHRNVEQCQNNFETKLHDAIANLSNEFKKQINDSNNLLEELKKELEAHETSQSFERDLKEIKSPARRLIRKRDYKSIHEITYWFMDEIYNRVCELSNQS